MLGNHPHGENLSPTDDLHRDSSISVAANHNALNSVTTGPRLQNADYPMIVRINLPLFSTVLPFNSGLFLSCRPFVVITTFSTGLGGVEVTSVSWLGSNFNTHKTC